MQPVQTPGVVQVAQLVTLQLEHCPEAAELTTNPGLQTPHWVEARHFWQLRTSQGSQLVPLAVFRVNPV